MKRPMGKEDIVVRWASHARAAHTESPLSLEEPFWQFSQALYAKEGVEAACLGLQDRRGLNVNLLLYCCWAGLAGGKPLDVGDLSEAVEHIAQWQAEVIQPLRWVRRLVKEGVTGVPQKDAEPAREQVKQAELSAERVEQKILQRLLPDLAQGQAPHADQPMEARVARAAANLLTYFAALRVAPEKRDRDAMAVLVRACAPDLSDPVAIALVAA